MDMLQQVGRRDVAHIERWVLAHQNDVHCGKVEQLRFAERKVIATFAPYFKRPGSGVEPVLPEHQFFGKIVEDRVPAGLGFQGEDKRAVRIDIDRFDGIHLYGNGEAHAVSRSS